MSAPIVAYIPAIHQGYLNLFTQHMGDIYILGHEYIGEYPRIERDIRAMKPELIRDMLRSILPRRRIEVLASREQIDDLPEAVILPNEAVSHAFAETYLANHEVAYVDNFLRWDRIITTTEFEIPADRVISHDHNDIALVREALVEASKSPDWWRQVGAVLITPNGHKLAAHNTAHLGGGYALGAVGDPRSDFDAGESIELSKFLHAEAGIIAHAASEGIALKNSSIYVSTFPCPVCAKSIAEAGIKKVYYAKGYSLVDAEEILKYRNVELILVEDKEKPL